jgi:predicted HAD superfamily hydrolase
MVVPSYNVLSFDIWDTVIRRKCHPDEIKLFVSRYIYLKYSNFLIPKYKDYYSIFSERCNLEGEIGQNSKLTGDDDEYLHSEVFCALLERISDGNIIEVQKVANELIEVELQQEKFSTYLDPDIETLIQSYQPKSTFFISDFYSDKRFIEELLAHVGFKHNYNGGYVSSEIRLNKRSGKLFKYFHNEQSVQASEHIHMGDSLIADVEAPNKIGINTFHYYNEIEENKRERNREEYEKRIAGRSYNISFTDINNASYSDKNVENELYRIGHENAVVFFAFVMEIIEEAVKKGHSKVYYLTREGEFFKEIHDIIAKFNPYGVVLPKAELLEVSRVATFAASIEHVKLEDFMRLWNQYSTQSMDAFFKSLNISISSFMGLLDKYSIISNEEIVYPWLNPNVQALFQDNLFCEILAKELDIKRSLLMDYFSEKGIYSNTNRIFLVDIGWRGTIQDNIAHIFSKTMIDGYYFGLFDFINQQPINTTKTSFVTKGIINRALRFVSPVEMLCNSASGSVMNYELRNNQIKVLKINDEIEDSVHLQYIKHFQNGVLSASKEITQLVKLHALTAQDLKKQVYDKLEMLTQNPPKAITQAFFSLAHNEMFGLGKYINKKVKFPYLLSGLAIISRSKRRKLKQYLEDSSWPQGLLIYKGMGFMNRLYNDHMNKIIEVSQPPHNNHSGTSNNLTEIEARDNLLEERYKAMMEMEAMIIERDATIIEQGKMLEERYQALKAMEQLIKERDLIINELEAKNRYESKS